MKENEGGGGCEERRNGRKVMKKQKRINPYPVGKKKLHRISSFKFKKVYIK
jgi:hypothetical protein